MSQALSTAFRLLLPKAQSAIKLALNWFIISFSGERPCLQKHLPKELRNGHGTSIDTGKQAASLTSARDHLVILVHLWKTLSCMAPLSRSAYFCQSWQLALPPLPTLRPLSSTDEHLGGSSRQYGSVSNTYVALSTVYLVWLVTLIMAEPQALSISISLKYIVSKRSL